MIQIGVNKVMIYEGFDGPIIIGDQVDTPMPNAPAKKRQEKVQESDKSKYYQPRWCPSSLTRTQKCKLQCLRLKEMWEQEKKKQQDELFNQMKLMVPQKK